MRLLLQLEFRFNEMAILGIRSTLPKERAFPFNKPVRLICIGMLLLSGLVRRHLSLLSH